MVDVLDYMIEKRVGSESADAYIKIAAFFEKKMKDLPKAEAILRRGIDYLGSRESLGLELKKLERIYTDFEKRVAVEAERARIAVKSCYKSADGRRIGCKLELEKRQRQPKVQLARDKNLEPEQKFTFDQKVIGGVPIFVDNDTRDLVIPKAKQ